MGGFLSILKPPVWLVCYTHGFHDVHGYFNLSNACIFIEIIEIITYIFNIFLSHVRGCSIFCRVP